MSKVFTPRKIDIRNYISRPLGLNDLKRLLKNEIIHQELNPLDYTITYKELGEYQKLISLNKVEEVHGNLYLHFGYISDISNLRLVKGECCLNRNTTTTKKLEVIEGDLDLTMCNYLTDITSLKFIGGDIYLPKNSYKNIIYHFNEKIIIEGQVYFTDKLDDNHIHFLKRSKYRSLSFKEYKKYIKNI